MAWKLNLQKHSSFRTKDKILLAVMSAVDNECFLTQLGKTRPLVMVRNEKFNFEKSKWIFKINK